MFWNKKKKNIDLATNTKKHNLSTDIHIQEQKNKNITVNIPKAVAGNIAQDSISLKSQNNTVLNMPEAMASWYAKQTFIGYETAAWLAKNWLIGKAISVPVADALRNGYNINSDDAELIDKLVEEDKKRKIIKTMQELLVTARGLGGAVAVFHTEAEEYDEDYYLNPLNMDAIKKYKGVQIVGADDVTPLPSFSEVSDPASLDYLNPTFYMIGLRKYHKSHLHVCTPFPVLNKLKPLYKYFGQSLPERIFERAYSAERTANEAPALTMTKRLKTMGVNLDEILSGDDGAMAVLMENVKRLRDYADNESVFIYNTNDGAGINQLETSLADLDAVIMTQYQLVASAANIPATKLLETSPKGFNATGEYEAESYRATLESIQSELLTDFLNKHHAILKVIENKSDVITDLMFAPLDSPTAKEFAEIDNLNTQTVCALVAADVISHDEARGVLDNAKDSNFYGKLTKFDEEANAEIDKEIDEALE